MKVFDFTHTHRGLPGFVQEVVLHVRCQRVLNMHDGGTKLGNPAGAIGRSESHQVKSWIVSWYACLFHELDLS